MPDQDPSDAALIRRIAEGDREAFKVVVGRHGATVHRAARAMTGDPVAADDVLQEVFLAVWRSAASFRGTASGRAWLLTITRNAVRRSYRRRAHEPDHPESLEELGAQAGWGVVDPGPSFEHVLADRERLARAFAALSTDDREILTVIELEGLDLGEAATTLELTIPATKSRLHRARLRLVAAVRAMSEEVSK